MNYDTTQNDLERLFSEAGKLEEVFLPIDRLTGRAKGFGFVNFTEETAAAEAIRRFNGHEFHGRGLRVSLAEERQRRSPNYAGDRSSARPRGPRGSKPKGSRRNLRAKKRGF